jgi:RNA polymerase sigma factor (sigma-70 family)
MSDSENPSTTDDSLPKHQSGRAFPTTQWSVVLGASATNTAIATVALEHLCSRYWQPIYVFVRWRGSSPHEAEDLTQTFFAFLLEKETLKKVDQEKGKFRTFLLAALTNFLHNQWDIRQALKRGGRRQIISLNDTAEIAFNKEPLDHRSPDKIFERQWATTLVENVLARLKKEYVEGGKEILFVRLEPELTSESNTKLYSAWAEELGLSANALQVALHRLRRRFGELLRSEIAHTVSSPEEVHDEIRHLFAAIGD